jgi:hypothetical protein
MIDLSLQLYPVRHVAGAMKSKEVCLQSRRLLDQCRCESSPRLTNDGHILHFM